MRRTVAVHVAALIAIAILLPGGGPEAGEARQSSGKRKAPPGPSIAPVNRVFFVAPSGDDSNPGTREQPWRTLAKAARTLKPGDGVFVREGTYNERLVPASSGAEGACIVYAAFPGELPVIDGAGLGLPEWGGLVSIERKRYIVISGLKVTNAGPHPNNAGILVDSSEHVVIERNVTHNTVSSGIGVWRSTDVVIDSNDVSLACNDGFQECITISVTKGFEVRGNHVHDGGPGTNGGEGIDVKEGSSQGRVYGNHVHHLKRNGIYVDAWDKHTFDIRVYGNTVHDCGHAFSVASESGGLLENVRVYNNLGYRCRDFSAAIAGWGNQTPHPMKDIYFVNNTFWGNGGGFLLLNGEVQNAVVRNNILSQNKNYQLAVSEAGRRELYTVDSNLFDGPGGWDREFRGERALRGQARFVDPEKGDFRLLPDSPAIDRGSPKDAPDTDFDGNARPAGAGFDIGAFEFGSRPARPAGPEAGRKTPRAGP